MVGTEAGGSGRTITKDADYTATVGAVTMTETDGSIYPASGAAYKIVSSIAAENAGWTLDSADWGVHIAVYKADGGGGVTVKTLAALGVG